LTTRGELDFTSGVMRVFIVAVMAVVMVDVVTRLTGQSLEAQYMRSQMYQGVTDPREVEATDEVTTIDLVNGYPYTPWVSANIINDGPDSVWVAVNQPDAAYELKADETASVNRVGAQERISTMFFTCDAGEEASIRVVGEY